MPLFERLKTVATFALLLSIVLACGQPGSPGEPTSFKSPDGKFQVTVPAEWKTSGSLSAGEIIRVENNRGDMAMVVMSKSKADLVEDAPLDKFAVGGRNGMLNDGNTSDATQPESLTVNGNDARQYEVKRDNNQNRCLITVVETSEDLHLITACTSNSKYDANKATLKQISESFRPA